jgi:hypothetical protein
MLWPQKAFCLPPCFSLSLSISLSISQTPLPQADVDISALIITTGEAVQLCWQKFLLIIVDELKHLFLQLSQIVIIKWKVKVKKFQSNNADWNFPCQTKD